jgi:hypothetical protein
MDPIAVVIYSLIVGAIALPVVFLAQLLGAKILLKTPRLVAVLVAVWAVTAIAVGAWLAIVARQ